MTIRLYTIYDRVAEEAGPIFSAINDGVAVRQFRQLSREISPIDKDSYKLYFLGQFDTSVMSITVEVLPSEVMTGMEVTGVTSNLEAAK